MNEGSKQQIDPLIERIDRLSDRVVLRISRIETQLVKQVGLLRLDLVQTSSELRALSGEVEELRLKMKTLIGNGADGIIQSNRKELEAFIRAEDEKVWVQIRKFSNLKTVLRASIVAVWSVIAFEVSVAGWLLTHLDKIKFLFQGR